MAEDTTTYTYSCGDKSGFEYYVLGDDIRAEFDFLKGNNTSTAAIAGNLDEMLMHLKVATSNTNAFYFEGSDLRLTFDTRLEAIAPQGEALFSPEVTGLPVLDGNSVIMEIKYGKYIPSFVRKFTSVHSKQLSVSKYALCREVLEGR